MPLEWSMSGVLCVGALQQVPGDDVTGRGHVGLFSVGHLDLNWNWKVCGLFKNTLLELESTHSRPLVRTVQYAPWTAEAEIDGDSVLHVGKVSFKEGLEFDFDEFLGELRGEQT